MLFVTNFHVIASQFANWRGNPFACHPKEDNTQRAFIVAPKQSDKYKFIVSVAGAVATALLEQPAQNIKKNLWNFTKRKAGQT